MVFLIKYSCACVGVNKLSDLYRVLSRQAAGKRPLKRLQCSADNINMDLKEIGWKGMDWMNHSG